MKFDKSLIAGSTALLILTLLGERDMYGYEMIQKMEERSDGTFLMNEGTLYPLLHKMEKDEWVQSYMQKAKNGKNRKYYGITDKGFKKLNEKREEWQLFSKKVNQVLGGEGYALQNG